jgi:hypothetical protein
MPVSTRAHLEALLAEQDKRMQVMADERSRAIAIKDRADEKALNLERETQQYKDEKANELRAQIESERGSYMTQEVYSERHEDLVRRIGAIEKTLAEGGGRETGKSDSRTFLFAVLGSAAAFLGILAGVLANAGVFG